jgi:hypothetical protein
MHKPTHCLAHMQGLGDVETVEHPELELNALAGKGCGLYYMVPDARAASGSVLREYWHIGGGLTSLAVTNPCQSTGIWYIQPTEVAVAFMRAMAERIAYHSVWQWDQVQNGLTVC